jgi:hypothetical protein
MAIKAALKIDFMRIHNFSTIFALKLYKLALRMREREEREIIGSYKVILTMEWLTMIDAID